MEAPYLNGAAGRRHAASRLNRVQIGFSEKAAARFELCRSPGLKCTEANHRAEVMRSEETGIGNQGRGNQRGYGWATPRGMATTACKSAINQCSCLRLLDPAHRKIAFGRRPSDGGA
jgi:hypothetical protein